MAEGVCLECGKDIPYDWAPCPHCGWKAPDAWETEAEVDEEGPRSQGLLAKPRSWISTTVWVLLAILLIGLIFTIRHYF